MKLRQVRLVTSAPSPATGRELTNFDSKDHDIDLKPDVGLVRIASRVDKGKPALIVHVAQTRFMLEAGASAPPEKPGSASVTALHVKPDGTRKREAVEGSTRAKVDSGPPVPEAG